LRGARKRDEAIAIRKRTSKRSEIASLRSQ
jgi:hypothetical protein